MVKTGVLVLAVVAAVSAGCGGGGAPTSESRSSLAIAISTTTPTSSLTAGSVPPLAPTSLDVVVIGDSLTDPAHCPGCSGFGEQYTAHLEQTLGLPVTYQRMEAMDVPEAVRVVTEDKASRTTIAEAEIVVVQVGYNNALPDPETGIGCGGSLGTTNEETIDWVLSTQPGCLAEGVATYGALYDQIFSGIEGLRAGKPTVYIVTNTLDGNNDPAIAGGLLLMSPSRSEEVLAWTVSAYERWNQMIAERAQTSGFELVDIWHEFNGPAGTKPMGELSIDGAHPSQAGNDLIATKLAEVDVSMLGVQQTGS